MPNDWTGVYFYYAVGGLAVLGRVVLAYLYDYSSSLSKMNAYLAVYVFFV
jgi:hypothetical protein